MHVPDLDPLKMPGLEDPSKLKAVGWLQPGHDYRHGDVARDFVDKLAELLVNPWVPAIAAGVHFCGFCRLTGGPSVFRVRDVANGPEVRIGRFESLAACGRIPLCRPFAYSCITLTRMGMRRRWNFRRPSCPRRPCVSMDYLKALLKHGPIDIVSK